MTGRFNRTIAMLLLLAVIGVYSGAAAGAADNQVHTIKITCNNAPFLTIGNNQSLDFIYAGALAFKNYCESNSNGRLKVEIYHSGQLGGTVEALQQCVQGVVQACFAGDGEMATLYPRIQSLSVPYLFNNRIEFYNMLDSEFMAQMYAEIEKEHGIKVLASADNGGFRNFSNSKRPVRNADDLKGLKIRCMEIPAHTIMLRALGATPTPMAWAELYTALQTGVVDGQENSPGTTLNGSLHEVTKYYTLDGHSISALQLYFNTAFLNKLPADLQNVVYGAGRVAQDANRGLNNANEALALDQLAAYGMEIYAPSDAEKDTFRRAQGPVVEWLQGQIGKEYVDKFMAAVEEAKTGAIAKAKLGGTELAQGGGTSSGPINSVTIAAIAVAAVAVIFALFMAAKGKRKE